MLGNIAVNTHLTASKIVQCRQSVTISKRALGAVLDKVLQLLARLLGHVRADRDRHERLTVRVTAVDVGVGFLPTRTGDDTKRLQYLHEPVDQISVSFHVRNGDWCQLPIVCRVHVCTAFA